MLSENDIKAELSYAYLHAVAAKAGFACQSEGRHLDGAGVDASIHIKERLDPASEYTDLSLHVQLKATSQALAVVDNKLSYALELPHYDKLRSVLVSVPRILVVLSLPDDAGQWLTVDGDQLVARRCGRWVSLRAAATSENATSQTVRLPMENVLTPAALREIARVISLGEDINYAD